jgi:diphosphomevalonate decarboxylase
MTELDRAVRPGVGRAEACANIALAKYWGKSPRGDNLTAVPSLSLTLDGLRTRTEVRFSADLSADQGFLDGQAISGRPLERVSALLDRVRTVTGERRHAVVTSRNDFPTAAGLASSASGFAALALAANEAAGARLSRAQLSSLARQSSASAARSLFGGFVELGAEVESAAPVAPGDHWDLVMLVAVIAAGPKAVASTGGMVHTAATSPLYAAWVADAPRLFAEVKRAVLERDFRLLAEAMEQSTLTMHATMFAARPPIVYFRGATLDCLEELRRWRSEGSELAFTMDAGPNVKVLTPSAQADTLATRLAELPGVSRVIRCVPGPEARLLSVEGELATARPLPPQGWPAPPGERP